MFRFNLFFQFGLHHLMFFLVAYGPYPVPYWGHSCSLRIPCGNMEWNPCYASIAAWGHQVGLWQCIL